MAHRVILAYLQIRLVLAVVLVEVLAAQAEVGVLVAQEVQAEAVALLIHSATDASRKAMLNQVEGAMGKAARSLKSDLLEAKVILESAIDFPEEEDVGELNLERTCQHKPVMLSFTPLGFLEAC